MNRTTQFLIGGVASLAVLTTVAAVAAPGEEDTGAAARLPVERSALLCPAPPASDLSDTVYTSITPAGKGGGASAGQGKADLFAAADADGPDAPADGKDKGKDDKGKDADRNGKSPEAAKPVLSPKEVGKPATVTTSDSEAPALIGSASGRLAPGWSVQQTSVLAAGSGRGVLGASCTAPDTEFWFPGVSTAKDRQDYVHLTNPDDTAAVVDLELYSKDGRLKAPLGEDVTVAPRSSRRVLISTLTSEPVTNIALHAEARAGRVGASVQAMDDELGSDWLPSSADPSGSAVLPGIPEDATSVRLVAVATGEDDADLSVRLAGPTGRLTPAGHESLHVKSGITSAVDLGDVTKGEAGSLVLTPAEGSSRAPFVAALRVTRGKGGKQETAFIPTTGPIGERGTIADNRAKGSRLSLVAPGKTAKVRVTATAGSGGGTPVSKTFTVKAGTTLAVDPPVPGSLKGGYALTVERISGGPVHASRMLELPQGGVPMFTVQTVPDDHGRVAVPHADQDMSLLTD